MEKSNENGRLVTVKGILKVIIHLLKEAFSKPSKQQKVKGSLIKKLQGISEKLLHRQLFKHDKILDDEVMNFSLL
jgi:hypothetical protein